MTDNDGILVVIAKLGLTVSTLEQQRDALQQKLEQVTKERDEALQKLNPMPEEPK